MGDEDIINLIMKEIQDLDVVAKPGFKGVVRSWGADTRKVFQIAVRLEETEGTNISEEEIIEKAKKEGIDEEDAQSIINELVTDGLFYRPSYTEGIIRFHTRQDYNPWSSDFPS